MSRIVYVNGAYLPEEEAKVSVFDRGFLFADGVYEVTSVLGASSSISRAMQSGWSGRCRSLA
jgi:branched-subunit amino acid aminotransferase/4-amino-4-deoxychorismate lyase